MSDDYRQEKREDETHTAFAIRCVFEQGAAVAFGLVGMAEAIRANSPMACAVCGKSVPRYIDVCSFDCVVTAERRLRPAQHDEGKER